MTFKEIQELIKLINKSNLTEFKMKDGDLELSIRTKKFHKGRPTPVVAPQQQILPVATPAVTAPVAAPIPAASPAPAPTTTDASSAKVEKKEAIEEEVGNYIEVKSPIVGTFYRSSSPEKGPYVKVGDTISKGDTVCIVEAMKLFNEIESEHAGKIVKVCVEDAQPVEYDTVLFLLEA